MKYIYIFLVLIVFIACKQPGNNHLNAQTSNPIPDSICYFFPDQSVCKYLHIPFDITERCNNPSVCCEFLAVVSQKEIDLDSLTDFIEKNSIQILNDTSKLVALRDREFDKRDFLDSSYANAQISNIIPDFAVSKYAFDNGEDIWRDSTTKTGLKPGYTLYVIKSGSTLILNEKWDCNRKWLPVQLRHGYRSGIAINPDNEYVIFWCVAW